MEWLVPQDHLYREHVKARDGVNTNKTVMTNETGSRLAPCPSCARSRSAGHWDQGTMTTRRRQPARTAVTAVRVWRAWRCVARCVDLRCGALRCVSVWCGAVRCVRAGAVPNLCHIAAGCARFVSAVPLTRHQARLATDSHSHAQRTRACSWRREWSPN